MVMDNAGTGVSVGVLSSLGLAGDNSETTEVEKNVIADNGGIGISLGGNSRLGGGGAHQIHGNGGRGISAQDSEIGINGQSPELPFEIFENGRQGVFLTSASGSLGGNIIVRANNQAPPFDPVPAFPFPGVIPCGVCLYRGSDVVLGRTQITDEPGHGLFLSVNSSAAVRSVTITGNSGDGARMEAASGVQFQSPGLNEPPSDVSNNGGYPLHCVDTDLSWVAGEVKDIKAQGCKVLKPTL
jgi:hypothetical protein